MCPKKWWRYSITQSNDNRGGCKMYTRKYSKSEFDSIEWKKIAGLRDILAHAYFGIDNTILWKICNFLNAHSFREFKRQITDSP